MTFLLHEIHNSTELSEIDVLLRLQRMLEKEFAHRVQRVKLADPQAISVAVIWTDYTRTKKPLQGKQDLSVPRMLNNDKLW
jgi:hypothetical protein